jgi:CheY-like chemotaxis protein
VAELAEADRQKNKFLAMLAHELRNPLAPVQSAVQLLRKHCPMDPDTQWAHDVIERQVLHMKRMVDDLLDVSRITRGMINLQKEVVDLATITNRAVEMIQPQIDARKHHLTITLPAQAVFLEADPPRLAQALANLFDNAAKYTNEGGEISLIAERQGNDILLRVRDNGSGIPLDYLPHVFDLFSQEDRSLERTRGGLGIGLTLVRTLIHMHGGAIEAFSAGTGQGSEFVVRLPALPESPSRPLPASTVESTGAVGSTPRRILVVDDNVDGARSLSILLRQMGHEVQTAFDGLAAVEMARKNPPEVVLLDIGMPQMNGLQVARCIRGELGLMNTLLVAMTGYGQDEDRHRSQEAGFNAHMVKPLDLDALAELLARPLIDLGVPDKA